MPLQKQNVPIDLKGGIANKGDEFLQVPAKLATLKDAVFTRNGTLERRDGYNAVTKTLISGVNSPGSIGRRMWAHKSQVLIESEAGLHELIRNGTASGTVNGSIEKNVPFALTTSNPTTAVRRRTHRAGISFTEVGCANAQDQYECDYARDENFTGTPGTGSFIYTGELECYVWMTDETTLNNFTTRRTAHVLVRNRNSGNVVFQDTLNTSATAVADHPRVIAVYPGGYASGTATKFWIYWSEIAAGAANLIYSSIDCSAPGSRTANATLSALEYNAPRASPFDVWYEPGPYTAPVDKICYVFRNATKVKIAYAAGTAPQTIVASDTTAATSDLASVTAFIFIPATGVHQYVALFKSIAAPGTIICCTVDLENTSTFTNTNISVICETNGRFTVCKNPASDKMLVFYDVNPFAAGEALPHAVYVASINPTGTVSTYFMPLAASVVIAGRPFMLDGTMNNTRGRFEGGRIHLPVMLLSKVQPTAYIVELPDNLASFSATEGCDPSRHVPVNMLARVLPGEFLGYSSISAAWRIPNNAVGGQYNSAGVNSSNTTVAFPAQKLGQLFSQAAATDAAAPQYNAHVLLAELDLNAELAQVSIGRGNTFLAGALPRVFDGDKCFEAGFNYFPEGLVATSSNSTGSITSLGVYQITVCYEWQDKSGALHRSQPAVPVSITMGAADDTILIKFPFMRLTDRGLGNSGSGADISGDIRLVVYRTTNAGTVFYRDPGDFASASSSDFTNNFLRNTVAQQQLICSDTDLVRGEQLYTTGGALANSAFPSCDAVTVYQNRLWMNDKAHTQTVRFTDEADDDDFAVATNEVYVVSVPGDSGDVNGVAVLDEKLIVFTKRQGYVTAGQAPNRLGVNNGLSPFQAIANSFGMRDGNPAATAVTPEGLWYLSEVGFRFLDRGLQIARDQEGEFVGSETDDILSATTKYRLLNISARNQIRFADLVYDLHFKQWSQFTNHTWAGWCVARDLALIFFYKADGTVYCTPTIISSTSPITDNGTPFAWYLETAWIKGLPEGFQRVYSLMLLGRPSINNDQPGLQRGISMKINVAFDYNSFDNSTDEIVSGLLLNMTTSNRNAFQVEHKLAQQKCETLRFRVSETGESVGGYDLTNLSLLLGSKPGLNRLSSDKRI